MVRENANVTLRCRAKGYPKPKISWRRENGKPIEFGNWQELKNVKVKMRKYRDVLQSVKIRKLAVIWLLQIERILKPANIKEY